MNLNSIYYQKNSLKTVFAQYEDIKMDLPNFFQFVAEVIAHASLIIYEKGSTIGLKNDIMKAVEKAYNEISGSECALFRDHLLKLIEQKVCRTMKNDETIH